MNYFGDIPISDWPANIIPAEAEAFVYEDDGCTIKGFRLNGVIHIQDVSTESRSTEVKEPALSALKRVG